MFSLSDYHYHLPENLIAQEAANPHHSARIMVVDRESGEVAREDTFWNLNTFLGDDRVLFFNDSKVFRSRIPLKNTRYTKRDGTEGVIKEGEIFFLRTDENNTFEALVRPGNKFQIGASFFVGNSQITVLEKTIAGRLLQIQGDSIFHLMEQEGNLPLPPYIEYTKEKEGDYQTSFAKKDGSVAAPTASLHFTKELLEKLSNEKEYVTLHVGLGTFKGIDTTDIRDYAIHRETIEIDRELFSRIATLKRDGKKIVAVGTTVCRTLESLPYLWRTLTSEFKKDFQVEVLNYWDTLVEHLESKNWIHAISIDLESGTLRFETSIYITPGYTFALVDDLVTNFHLPESSLLVLVSAFLGHRETMSVYAHAIERGYRFYSFGDGMYIRGK